MMVVCQCKNGHRWESWIGSYWGTPICKCGKIAVVFTDIVRGVNEGKLKSLLEMEQAGGAEFKDGKWEAKS